MMTNAMPTGTVAKEQQNITSEPPLPPPFAIATPTPVQSNHRAGGFNRVIAKPAKKKPGKAKAVDLT